MKRSGARLSVTLCLLIPAFLIPVSLRLMHLGAAPTHSATPNKTNSHYLICPCSLSLFCVLVSYSYSSSLSLFLVVGQVVAVKVRHPGVASTIARDFEAMLWVAHLFAKMSALEHLRLEDTLKQFAAPLKEQV